MRVGGLVDAEKSEKLKNVKGKRFTVSRTLVLLFKLNLISSMKRTSKNENDKLQLAATLQRNCKLNLKNVQVHQL